MELRVRQAVVIHPDSCLYWKPHGLTAKSIGWICGFAGDHLLVKFEECPDPLSFRESDLIPVCPNCGEAIDYDVCHCGDGESAHAMMALGHSFTPIMCDCQLKSVTQLGIELWSENSTQHLWTVQILNQDHVLLRQYLPRAWTATAWSNPPDTRYITLTEFHRGYSLVGRVLPKEPTVEAPRPLDKNFALGEPLIPINDTLLDPTTVG